MDEAPWGIGAWEFLGLYWIGFALAVLVALVAVGLLRRDARATVDQRPLGHYELAWIAGGAARVEEVALAGMLAADRIRVDGRGVVSWAPTAQASDPVQQWLLGVIGTGRQLAGAGSLGFADTQLHRELVEDLVARGHVVKGGRESPGYASHRVLGVVLAIGVARLIAELDWGWQVGILLISLVVSGAIWFGFAFVLRAGELRTSDRGKAAVAQVDAQVGRIPDLRADPRWIPAAVAVEGIAAYPDLAVATLVAVHTRPGRRATGS